SRSCCTDTHLGIVVWSAEATDVRTGSPSATDRLPQVTRCRPIRIRPREALVPGLMIRRVHIAWTSLLRSASAADLGLIEQDHRANGGTDAGDAFDMGHELGHRSHRDRWDDLIPARLDPLEDLKGFVFVRGHLQFADEIVELV